MFNEVTKPDFSVPSGASDCHIHVFGEADAFPFASRRGYTPSPAAPETFLAGAEQVGIRRAVLVQPSAYGSDNTYLLNTLERFPDQFRGVAVLGPDCDRATLKAMDARGVRAVRLNLVSMGEPDPNEAAERLQSVARSIADLGWHLQVFIRMSLIDAVEPALAELAVPVVFDHMGLPEAERGLEQKGMSALLRLLDGGKCWVKLSGSYHVSPEPLGTPDVTHIARAFLRENSERAVWGTDWPHIEKHARVASDEPPHVGYRDIDYGQLLSCLADWCDGRSDLLSRVLIDNPQILYGF